MVAPRRLVLIEAVGKTTPRTGASMGRGTTVPDARVVRCFGGTTLSTDTDSGGSAPPLRAQLLPTYFPDSLHPLRQSAAKHRRSCFGRRSAAQARRPLPQRLRRRRRR